jgi:[acyl-carrier-protein] S-malonyltransferase
VGGCDRLTVGYALVFSGQGMQHPGMLPWLAHDDTLREVDRELGRDWRERLGDVAWAGLNAHAQVLLTGLALAAWSQLAAHLPPPAIVAGYSVGEIAAFSVAGVFDTPTALALARQRAVCMDEAAAQADTGLLGVTNTTPNAVQALCAEFDLDIAILNGVGSVVLGGPRAALDDAARAAASQGMRCTPLNVAIASHTRWMAPAANAFAQMLVGAPIARPRRPLLSDALGRVLDAAHAREALSAQLARTVRWDECQEAIAAQRVAAVLEIGPGHALARMWQQRYPDVPARSADEFRSAAAVVAWVRGLLGLDH